MSIILFFLNAFFNFSLFSIKYFSTFSFCFLNCFLNNSNISSFFFFSTNICIINAGTIIPSIERNPLSLLLSLLYDIILILDISTLLSFKLILRSSSFAFVTIYALLYLPFNNCTISGLLPEYEKHIIFKYSIYFSVFVSKYSLGNIVCISMPKVLLIIVFVYSDGILEPPEPIHIYFCFLLLSKSFNNSNPASAFSL